VEEEEEEEEVKEESVSAGVLEDPYPLLSLEILLRRYYNWAVRQNFISFPSKIS